MYLCISVHCHPKYIYSHRHCPINSSIIHFENCSTKIICIVSDCFSCPVSVLHTVTIFIHSSECMYACLYIFHRVNNMDENCQAFRTKCNSAVCFLRLIRWRRRRQIYNNIHKCPIVHSQFRGNIYNLCGIFSGKANTSSSTNREMHLSFSSFSMPYNFTIANVHKFWLFKRRRRLHFMHNEPFCRSKKVLKRMRRCPCLWLQ